ncbi:hypothetical protein CVM73_23010 [Bradyrhizobium forestalis]|uniref:Uncharacterized protein n=1 Tax=Bradyrhizobium forestalis TaxID=1419263 RepID=A0A2M8R594_9BRAD|nr:hypothetical protein CVM73_23010 [Bradyrhizobium forestalis]
MWSMLPESAPDDGPTRGLIVALDARKNRLAQLGRATHADIVVGNAGKCGRRRYANGGSEYSF